MQRGDGTRVLTLSKAGGLLPNAIYIYIRKLNFLGSLFWRGFGEVLERFWRARIIEKPLVFIGFSIESIEQPLVFLGFSGSGEVLERSHEG